MDYKIEDLIDMPLFQSLQDKLNDIYTCPSAIIDNEGKVHTATGWQDICTKFHRINPDSCKECIISDKYILDHIQEADPAVTYNCPHGLTDSAIPIIIEGKHLGNFFIGQFFLEPPNIEFFKNQAKKYGFDEKSYLEAVDKVPVWSQDQLDKYLIFIKQYTETLAHMGLTRLKEKESHDLIKESRQRYQTLFNSGNDAVFVHQPKGELTPGTFQEVNDAACTLLGYSREELLNLTPFDTTFQDEQGKKAVREAMKELRRTGSVRAERTFVHRDGHHIPVEISARLFKYREIDTIITIAHDITRRKKAEDALIHAAQEWRITFDSIKDMIAIVDDKHTILRVNKAFADALEMQPQQVIGKSCYKVIHSMNQPHPMCPHARTLITRKVESSEYFDKKLNVWVEASSSPIFDTNNHLTGSVHILKDITERKHEEQEKQQLRDKAELSSRLATLGEMAAGIAHEINNPLTGVIGFSEMLMDRDLPADVKEELKIINDGSQRVKEIVRRMLTFARQTKPVKTEVSVHELIDNTLEIRGYVLKTANIKVIKNYDPDLPRITADPGQLQQVFLNIIVNAEHAMKKAHGKVSITITTSKTDDHIRLTFRDDGPGMSEETKTKLFHPFYTTKDPGEGTGLGLSMSRAIILEHNGTIAIGSEPDSGATFIIELPFTPLSESTGKPPVKAPAPKASKRKSRVLVVDDEPAIRSLIRAILTKKGHTVEETGKPEEVFIKLEQASYDIILLDIRMPGMSGIELYKSVIKKYPKLGARFIFITGDTSDSETMAFLNYQNLSYIAKPFSRETLEEKVNWILSE